MSHTYPFSRLRLRPHLPRLAQANEHMLNLLMQPRQHLYAHRHAGDERAVQSLRRRLAILCRLGDGG